MVKKVIMNFASSKASGPDWIPVGVPKTYVLNLLFSVKKKKLEPVNELNRL